MATIVLRPINQFFMLELVEKFENGWEEYPVHTKLRYANATRIADASRAGKFFLI